jgi:predicted Zn-dependent peptidase
MNAVEIESRMNQLLSEIEQGDDDPFLIAEYQDLRDTLADLIWEALWR